MSRNLWILVCVAFAAALAGLALFLTNEAPQRRAVDAPSEVRASDPAPGVETQAQLASAHEDAPRAVAPETKPEARETVDDSELASALWVTGRIVFPPNTPLDEEVWVVARGRKFEKRPLHRAKVERDGSFRVAFAPKSKKSSLALEAHYLYLEEPCSLTPAEPPQELVLKPKVGGRIRGVAQLAAPRTELVQRARGAPVRVNGWDPSGMDRGMVEPRTVKLDDALAFDLGGLAPLLHWNLQIDPPDMADAERSDLRVEAGKTLELEVELHEGASAAGVVLDDDGKPLTGAKMLVQYAMRSSMGKHESDAEGRVSMSGLTPGALKISASKSGYVTKELDLGTVKDGDRHERLEWRLSRGLSISGRVTWPDGSPAAGASVAAKTEGDERGFFREREPVKANDDGAFELRGLEAGSYEITASARREEKDAAAVTEAAASADAEAKSSDSADTPAPKKKARRARGPTWTVTRPAIAAGTQALALVLDSGLALSGRVVDDSGAPRTKFTIVATPAGDQPWEREWDKRRSRSFESQDGSFLLEGLSRGRWAIVANVDALSSREELVDLPLSGTQPAFTVPRSCVLHGVVRDASGAPAADARVRRIESGESSSAFGFGDDKRKGTDWAACDAEGRFRFDALPAGITQLVAIGPNAADSAPLEVRALPGENAPVQLTLRNGGTIRGVVLGKDGRPQAGRTVGAWRQETSASRNSGATTDADGRYSIEHAAPGRWSLHVRPTEEEITQSNGRFSGGFETRSIEVVDGATVEVNFGGVEKDAVLVRGLVTRAGKPLANTYVNAWAQVPAGGERPRSARGTAGDDGRYELHLPTMGKWTITFTTEGGGALSRELEIAAGPAATLDVEFPNLALRGRVVDREGQPVSGLYVRASPAEQVARGDGPTSSANVQSAADGSFVLDALAPGTYDVSAQAAGGPTSDQRWGRTQRRGVVLPADGRAPELVLVVDRAGRVTGTVVGIGGAPQGRARVSLQPLDPAGDARGGQATADEAGRFALGGLAPGTYVARAAHESGVTREPRRIEVRAGEKSEVQLVLQPGGTVLVAIVDSTGKHVGGWCRFTDERGGEVPQVGNTNVVPDPSGGAPSYVYGPFAPGRYRVSTANAAGVEASGEVTVSAGAQATLTLTLATESR